MFQDFIYYNSSFFLISVIQIKDYLILNKKN